MKRRHSRGRGDDRITGRSRPRGVARLIFAVVFLFALGASAQGGIAIDWSGEAFGLGLFTLAGLASVTLLAACVCVRERSRAVARPNEAPRGG